MLTIRHLELFAQLPYHSTLSSAAAALHISESALSHALSEMESTLGEQLCVRRRAKGMYLTPAGRLLANSARNILKEMDELFGDIASLGGELRGPLAIGCFVGLAGTVLPPVMEDLAKRHPQIDVRISVGDHDDLIPQLRNGELDTAILYHIDLPADLSVENIYPTEVMAILPRSHPLAQADAVDLKALASEPLIELKTTPSSPFTQKMFAERRLTPTPYAAVPQIDLVRALVGRGLGYSLLMRRPWPTTVTPEGLPIVALPLHPRAGITNVVAAWSRNVRPSNRLRAFVDSSVDLLAEKQKGSTPHIRRERARDFT